MTPALLGLGLVFGMRHALEADHVATVASLASSTTAVRDAVRVATAWGVGHGSAVLLVGAGLRATGLALPGWLTSLLECTAGLILVLLGLDVLLRLRRPAADAGALAAGAEAVQVHRPAAARPAEESVAAGAGSAVRRAFVVGSLHGMAGSSVLMVAIVPTFSSAAAALGYLALFGLGCVVGMVLCSLVISLPVRRAQGGLRSFRLAVGAASVAIGCWVAVSAMR